MKRVLLFILSCFIFTSLNAGCKDNCKKDCDDRDDCCIKELSCGCIVIQKCRSKCCSIRECEGQCLVKLDCENECSDNCRSRCNSRPSCNRNNNCNNNNCNTCNSCFRNNFDCRCFEQRHRISENWEWPAPWP